MIKDLWYKNTVIYSLDLETFMDTNGDGIGDFEGLIRRFDYLHTLGIGGIRIRCSTGWSDGQAAQGMPGSGLGRLKDPEYRKS
jgi:hypothetical protein